MQSVLDPFYQIIWTFFPSELIAIPFFNFLITLLIFFFCATIFYIFFFWPILTFFRWIRVKLVRG